MDNSHLSTQISQANQSDYYYMIGDTAQVECRITLKYAEQAMQLTQGQAFHRSFRLLEDFMERSKARMRRERHASSSSSEEQPRIPRRREVSKSPAKRCICCGTEFFVILLAGCEHFSCSTCVTMMCKGQEFSEFADCKNCFFNFKLLEHASGITKKPIPGLTKHRPRFASMKIDLNLRQCRERLKVLQGIIEGYYEPGMSPLRRII